MSFDKKEREYPDIPSSGITFRAGTGYLGTMRGMILYWSDHLFHSGQDIKDARLGDVVKHVPAIPPVLDQASLAQHHKLLRDVRLPVSQMSLHVAYAVLTFSEDIKDCQTRWMGQYFEQLYLCFISLGCN